MAETHEQNERWERFASSFRQTAEAKRRTPEFIDSCLAYARALNERGLPVIFDIKHLARLVGYKRRYLLAAAAVPSKFYRTYSIPKRKGGEREINEPLPSLMEVQRWILDNVLYAVDPSRYATAYVPGRSIKNHARFHRGQSVVICLDLHDFFPSISSGRVYGVFRGLGYTKKLCAMLTDLCTYDGVLPQGAPTSAALSNIICRSLDGRLAGFAKKQGLRYTRYADDIAFSGAANPNVVISFVSRAIREEGFTLREDKTRVLRQHQRQLITGIVVNAHMQVPLEKRKELRQAVHFIERFGLEDHLMRIGEKRANYLLHLLGLAKYIAHINPRDEQAHRAAGVLEALRKNRTQRD